MKVKNADTIKPVQRLHMMEKRAVAAREMSSRMNDESEHIERARLGDVESFEWLYERHKSFVWNVAFRMTYQRQSAEDLAQEVFLTAWRKLPDFKGTAAFSTWLYRITVNTTLNWRRDSMRWASLREDKSWETGFHSGDNNPERALMALEAERALHKLLGQLEKDRRLAFILRELEGLSYEEIAASTGWAIGTVRSRLARARQELSRLAENMEK